LFNDEIIGSIRRIYADDIAIYEALIGTPLLFT
jgi:hypothetical protein